MIPLRDDQPRTTRPYVTYSIMVLNLAVFAYEIWISMQERQAWYAFLVRYAEIPHHFQLAFQGSQYTISGAFLTIFTSMFIHAGWLHVLGNMWFLWIFGDNVEDHFGHATYALFYLFCGFVGSMAQLFANPTSDVPTIGASGAIAGVLGGYFELYPGGRIRTILPGFALLRPVDIPAITYLLIWFGVQLFSGISSSPRGPLVGGVAWWAHIGGFLFGVASAPLIATQPVKRRRTRQHQRPSSRQRKL